MKDEFKVEGTVTGRFTPESCTGMSMQDFLDMSEKEMQERIPDWYLQKVIVRRIAYMGVKPNFQVGDKDYIEALRSLQLKCFNELKRRGLVDEKGNKSKT